MQAGQRLRSISRLAPRLASTSLNVPVTTSNIRHRCMATTSNDDSPNGKKPTPQNSILSRLLASNDGKQNRLLAALGFYSSESRAIGAGNTLYTQALARANAAAAVEAHDIKDFAPRFEMLSVHVYLTLRRLRAEKGSPFEPEVKTVMQCIFDMFWTDVRSRMIMQEHGMNLIQSGRWIKDCEQRFFGMALAFDEAWGDDHKMKDAIKRNITCLDTETSRIDRFFRYMVRERSRLDKATVEQIWEGACWDDNYPHVHTAQGS